MCFVWCLIEEFVSTNRSDNLFYYFSGPLVESFGATVAQQAPPFSLLWGGHIAPPYFNTEIRRNASKPHSNDADSRGDLYPMSVWMVSAAFHCVHQTAQPALSRAYHQLCSFPQGHQGVVTTCHFDEEHNFFAQVIGSKRVILYPPTQASCNCVE